MSEHTHDFKQASTNILLCECGAAQFLNDIALPVSPAPTPPSREAVERLRVELAKHDDGADNFLIDAVRNLLTVPPVPATASDAEMRPSEAVLMFGAWLTTRDEVAGPFSGHHDASQMAELVAEYAKRQGWLPVRDDWLRSASASVEPVVTEVLTTEDWEWLNKASSSEMSPLYPKGLAATCKRILAALSQQGGGK